MVRRAPHDPALPPFSRRYVLGVAFSVFAEYRRAVGLEDLFTEGLDFDRLYQHVILPRYGITLEEGCDLGVCEDGTRILGAYDWHENTAFIDVSLSPQLVDPRRTFTLYHEVVGHGVLQGAWLRENTRPRQRGRIVTTGASLSPSTVSTLELQANLCAANAAAPMWMVDRAIFLIMDLWSRKVLRFHGPGRYTLGGSGACPPEDILDFEDYCRTIAWRIQRLFGGLSKEALSYRVQQSTLIECVPGAQRSLHVGGIPWRDDGYRAPTHIARGLLRVARAAQRARQLGRVAHDAQPHST